jgi:hypothetical protein
MMTRAATAIIHQTIAPRLTLTTVIATSTRQHSLPAARAVTLMERLIMPQRNVFMTMIQTVLDFGIIVSVTLYLAISLMLQLALEILSSAPTNASFTSFILCLRCFHWRFSFLNLRALC